MHTRAQIRLDKISDIQKFVSTLNSDGTTDKYVLENFDGSYRADARSLLGVMYMSTEYADETFLVNLTHDGEYPFIVDSFRI